MFRSIGLAALTLAAPAAITPASAQHPTQYRGQLDDRYGYQDRTWRDSNAFWPGNVAAGVVGGAVGAAGAIATAPFQAGYQGGYDVHSYAARNGFVCIPGTMVRGEDGLMHLCQ